MAVSQAAVKTLPEMVTPRQAAARGILPERAIRRLIHEGKIQTVRSGRTQYFNYTKLCQDLQSGTGAIWSDESEVRA